MLPVTTLTDIVPRPELVESWTEDELLAALHEATLDWAQFKSVLDGSEARVERYEGVRDRSPNPQSAYCPDRLDPGWRRSRTLAEKNGASLV